MGTQLLFPVDMSFLFPIFLIIVEQQEPGEHEEGAREESGLGLDFLRQLPQFEQLRELVHNNPAVLPQIIQQIAQSNPALMEAIQNNQVCFFTCCLI